MKMQGDLFALMPPPRPIVIIAVGEGERVTMQDSEVALTSASGWRQVLWCFPEFTGDAIVKVRGEKR